jgi:hypothetical protein
VRIATQAVISVVALGLIGTIAYFGSVMGTRSALFAATSGRMRGLGSHIGNSPIMASGGSMTFRSTTPWFCDTVPSQNYHTKCVTTTKVSIASIAWDNVLPFSDSAVGVLGWTNLSTAWRLDIWARDVAGNAADASGNPIKVGGVMMCTTSTNTITANAPICGGAPTYLLIMVEGSSVDAAHSGVLGLMDSTAAESGTYAKQYFDSKCNVHDASNNKTIPGCEHPGIIVSSIDSQTYKCQHGNCLIAIDQ